MLLLHKEQVLDMSSELWSNDPELQRQFEEIQATTRRMQAEFGIVPRTLEERARDYELKKAEEARRAEELKKLKQTIGQHRPVPKWKV